MHALPQLSTISLARRMVELAKEANDLRAKVGRDSREFNRMVERSRLLGDAARVDFVASDNRSPHTGIETTVTRINSKISLIVWTD